MIDVVFSELMGRPTQHHGGGNRIIYDIIKNISSDEFSCRYFSYLCQMNIDTLKTNLDLPTLSLKKKLGMLAFVHLGVYKRIVSTPLYQRFYFKRVKRFFLAQSLRLETDIIHSHHPVALAYLSEHTSAKKILTLHSKGGFAYEVRNSGSAKKLYEDDILELSLQERKAVERADYVTFPSIAAKNLFFEKNDAGCDDRKVRIVYNGVDLQYVSEIIPEPGARQKYRLPSSADLFILNVAEHSKQKHISLLLKVMKIIVHVYRKNSILVNVGEGPETSELRKMVEEFDLQKNVFFLGSLPNREVIGLMKLCDCFVLTSENVVFDLVVLEALACGAAVFLSDDGGNREIISNGVNGYLLQNKSEEQIAKSLMEYDRVRIKKEAQRSVAKYSIDSMVRSYEQLYHEAMDDGYSA
jgi:glycosyltransferase involved in cell wall biosynthesis